MSTSVDVVIAGGGPVGAFAALCLRNTALSVVHVDSGKPGTERPIALSHGSRLLLAECDVFDRIANTPIRTIHVSQRGAFGRAVMTAEEFGLPALGYVADYGGIRSAMSKTVPPHSGRVTGWAATSDGVDVQVCDRDGLARIIHAGLLVLADGTAGAALLDEVPGSADRFVTRDYLQCAIVAQVRTEISHGNRAYERFTPDGPLALLPNGDGFALVWCVSPDAASDLAEAEDKTFLASLGMCFGLRLGKFVEVSGRRRFPLSLRFMKNNPDARVVSIGNAAQSLHPVAGQGLNLGLRDAWELAQALLDPEISIAHPDFAKSFMRHRATDRRMEIGLTDLLARTFSRFAPPLGPLRGAALLAIDVLPPVRRLLGNFMLHGSRPNRMAAMETDAGAVREKIVTLG